MEIKIKNWRIHTSGISGWLIYEGKVLPRWGGSERFILGERSVYYDYPEVVPAYIKDKLESLREDIYM